MKLGYCAGCGSAVAVKQAEIKPFFSENGACVVCEQRQGVKHCHSRCKHKPDSIYENHRLPPLKRRLRAVCAAAGMFAMFYDEKGREKCPFRTSKSRHAQSARRIAAR